MRKFILDIDTGIDDSLALSYLCAQKDIEIAGVTTTYGNVTAQMAYQNTVNLLSALGRQDVKAYRGSETQLDGTPYFRDDVSFMVHGENGIGNAYLPEAMQEETGVIAWDFMIESAEKYGKDLTIICVGPMTNIAKAIMKNRAAIEKAGRIVIMGGALVVPGNVNRFAEANVYSDPEAAKILLESGLPITMTGLDVTEQTLASAGTVDKWLQNDTVAAKALYQMCVYYYTNEGESTEDSAGCLHDPLAVGIALDPDIVTLAYDCDITVETEGPSRGRTIGRQDRIAKGDRTTRVALRVKSEEFKRKFVDDIYNLTK